MHLCHAPFYSKIFSCRYVYDRKAEPALGNIIGEWFTRKFHNAKTLVRHVTHWHDPATASFDRIKGLVSKTRDGRLLA